MRSIRPIHLALLVAGLFGAASIASAQAPECLQNAARADAARAEAAALGRDIAAAAGDPWACSEIDDPKKKLICETQAEAGLTGTRQKVFSRWLGADWAGGPKSVDDVLWADRGVSALRALAKARETALAAAQAGEACR